MQQLLFTFIILTSLTAIGQSQKTYSLQPESSTIQWLGSYTFLMSEHKGTVQFKEGELYTTNGNITGGQFTIDMTTITNPEYRDKGVGPVDHLRNEDFFDVSRYPVCYLKITSVEYFTENNKHKFLADLTIKDVTKSIEFWGTAHPEIQQLTTQFKIDRTRWGIVHNNKIKEHAISEAIAFDVTLQFKANTL
ncbi:YceI family protein [Marinirhabdus gelatinilytica]|uniref:Polyisoprenoid-binding protein YceI n=1 Tax=Marinirhabdus gelatinilytica TaxID=1703343 RepID=A0A370QA36_9FLAO|nr:YceI family protein [Marinirhabdus gelatinilytica]RDK85224.1 polyisoprenoid-binding protein YceI [Marinirhabdus gelatinilytica]